MKLYQDIFQRAWGITKQHPALWLLGLLSLFWTGKGVELEQFFTNLNVLRSRFSPLNPRFWFSGQWEGFVELFGGEFGFYFFALLVLALATAVFLLIIVTQIGIVDAFGTYAKKKNATEQYTFRHAVIASQRSLGTVAGLQLVGRGLAYGLLIAAALPLYTSVITDAVITNAFLLFIVVTPLTIIISVVLKFAVNAVVLHKATFMQAIAVGWEMFRRNVGTTIEFVAMVYGGYLFVTTLAVGATLMVTAPVYALASLLAEAYGSELGITFFSNVLYGVGVIFVLLGFSIFSAWHLGSWTLLYQELTKGRRRSKIHRLLRGE